MLLFGEFWLIRIDFKPRRWGELERWQLTRRQTFCPKRQRPRDGFADRGRERRWFPGFV